MSRRFLFRLFAAAVPTADHVSDRELLRRFAATRDSAAFELIVRRHADAVWAAARRIVGNEADADDVFQAAFLALMRKAATIRESCVGGWLYRVAVNAALKSRAGRTPGANPGVAPHVDNTPGLAPGVRLESDELAAVIHQELARLPDRYRLPVVLCDLEGQTHAEAAKVLGWPIGSVSGRLSRAHRILRERLTRRGLTAPAALLTASVAPTGSVATASGIATGTINASPVVSTLTEGVLSAMRFAKLKLTAAVLTATGLVAMAGVGTVTALTQTGPPIPSAVEVAQPFTVAVQTNEPKAEDWLPKKRLDPVPTAFPDIKPTRGNLSRDCPRIWGRTPVAILDTDDQYRRLLKARLHQCCLELSSLDPNRRVFRDSFQDQLRCQAELLELIVELWANDRATQAAWLEEVVMYAKHEEELGFQILKEAKTPSESIPVASVTAMRRHRLEAEGALVKAKK